MGAKELRIENIEWRIKGIKPFSLKFSNSFIISRNDRIIKFQNIKKKSFKASKLPSLRAFSKSCGILQKLRVLIVRCPESRNKVEIPHKFINWERNNEKKLVRVNKRIRKKSVQLPENVFSSDALRLYALSFDEGGVNMWLKTRLKFPMK